MATGLKPVTSPESEASTFIVSGRLTGNGTSFSGDGWSATHTAGDNPYVITVTNATGIYTVITDNTYGTAAALNAARDTANVGRGFLKVISGNQVTLTVYDEVDNNDPGPDDLAVCPLDTDEYLDFVIVAYHYGK